GVVLADDEIDAAIVISTTLFAAPPDEIAAVLRRVATTTDKTLVGCLLAWAQLPPLIGGDGDGRSVPAYPAPEPAARALARAAHYAAWRRRPPGRLPDLDGYDPDQAAAVVEGFLADQPDGGWLSPEAVTAVLGAAGVPATATVEVSSAEEAARAAAEV